MTKELVKVKVTKIPFCDFCKNRNIETPASYDARSKYGPWAYMCEDHFKVFGVGLGAGKGQKLIKK